jgi:hypothetical protein
MDFKDFSKDLSVIRKENLSEENNNVMPLNLSLSNILNIKQESQKSTSEETLNMCIDLSTYKKDLELENEILLDKSDDSIKQFSKYKL